MFPACPTSSFPLTAVCIPPMENRGVALHPELLTPVQRLNSQAYSLYDGLALHSQECAVMVVTQQLLGGGRTGGARRRNTLHINTWEVVYIQSLPPTKSALDWTQRENCELKREYWGNYSAKYQRKRKILGSWQKDLLPMKNQLLDSQSEFSINKTRGQKILSTVAVKNNKPAELLFKNGDK